MESAPFVGNPLFEFKALIGRTAGKIRGGWSKPGGGVVIDSRGRKWTAALHPRDSRGRFIETGGIARVFGKGQGKVVRITGRDSVEVQFADGRKESVQANRVTMIRRPDGSSPTKSRTRVLDEDEKRAKDPKRGDAKADDNPDLDGDGIPDDEEPDDDDDEDEDDPGDDEPQAAPRAGAVPGDMAVLTIGGHLKVVDVVKVNPDGTVAKYRELNALESREVPKGMKTPLVRKAQVDRDRLRKAMLDYTDPQGKPKTGFDSPDEAAAFIRQFAKQQPAPEAPQAPAPGREQGQDAPQTPTPSPQTPGLPDGRQRRVKVSLMSDDELAAEVSSVNAQLAALPDGDKVNKPPLVRRLREVKKKMRDKGLDPERLPEQNSTPEATPAPAPSPDVVPEPTPPAVQPPTAVPDAPLAAPDAPPVPNAPDVVPQAQNAPDVDVPEGDGSEPDAPQARSTENLKIRRDGAVVEKGAYGEPDGTEVLGQIRRLGKSSKFYAIDADRQKVPGAYGSQTTALDNLARHLNDRDSGASQDSDEQDRQQDERAAEQSAAERDLDVDSDDATDDDEQEPSDEDLVAVEAEELTRTPEELAADVDAALSTPIPDPASERAAVDEQVLDAERRAADARAATAEAEAREAEARASQAEQQTPETITPTPTPEETPDEPVRSPRAEVLDDVPAESDSAAGRPDGALREPRRGSAGGGRAADVGPDPEGARGDGEGAGDEGGAAAGGGDRTGAAGVPDAGARDGAPGAGVDGPAGRVGRADGGRAGGKRPGGVAPGANGKGAKRFRPSGQGDLAPETERGRLDANLEALRTLRTLQAENRPATEAEQRKLARWAGWGSLGALFNEDNPKYAAEREEAKELLGEAGWQSARTNTMNAHYTDAALVAPMWEALRALGFQGGNVLEPGSGSGNFIGHAPDDARMVGVELDPTTAGIASYLYPDATIRRESFADTDLPDGTFDAVIGNVPFGQFEALGGRNGIQRDEKHNASGHSIHNHFILKSLALAKPGALVAVLTSRFTMDGGGAKNRKARQEMNKLGDLVGAVRLPEGAHKKAAGTGVVTDMLVFRKRKDGEAVSDPAWLEAPEMTLADGSSHSINAYFQARPDKVLGELRGGGGQFGNEATVISGEKDVIPAFKTAMAGVVDDARVRSLTADADTSDEDDLIDLALPAVDPAMRKQEGRIEFVGEVVTPGKTARSKPTTTLSFTERSSGKDVPYSVPSTQAEELRSVLGLRDTLAALFDAEQSTLAAGETDQLATLRRKLNQDYDRHVKKFGAIGRFEFAQEKEKDEAVEDGEVAEPKPPRRSTPGQGGFRSDSSALIVAALEGDYDPESKTAPKSAVFRERQIAPRQVKTTADRPEDAVALSLESTGKVDLPFIARALSTDEASARTSLLAGGMVFRDPDGDGALVSRADYLSGNVRRKLAAAEKAVEDGDKAMQANVDALKEVVPADRTPEEIDVKFGASWVPVEYLRDFLAETIRYGGTTINHFGGSNWEVKVGTKQDAQYRRRNSVLERETWGTSRMSVYDLLSKQLNQRTILVKDVLYDEDGKEIGKMVNQTETDLARAKAEELTEAFKDWAWGNTERANALSRLYNDKFMAEVHRNYENSPERAFEGMTAEIRLRQHQVDAVTRMTNEPGVLLDHVVGAGKTYTMVAGAMELRRLGMAKKPAIVVPNHLLEQFTREFLELYPKAKVLAADSKALSGTKRKQFLAKARGGDWDAVILTQESFQAIPVSVETEKAYVDKQITELLDRIAKKQAAGGKKAAVKEEEKAIERLKARLGDLLKTRKDDGGLIFEDTGIDYLMVDEAHHYKNLTTPSSIPGAGKAIGSKQATDLDMKLGVLRDRTGGDRSRKVVTLATGTPIANSVSEAYVMQKYLRPDLLEDAGITDFDTWAATFGNVEEFIEADVSGTKFRAKARFAQFVNVGEMLRMWRVATDSKTADDLNLPRPEIKAGEDGERKARNVDVGATSAQQRFIQHLAYRADNLPPDPSIDNLLKIASDGRKGAQDLRLVDRDTLAAAGIEEWELDADSGEKVAAVAAQVGRIYQDTKDKVFKVRRPKDGENPDDVEDHPDRGALQIVFADMGTPKTDGTYSIYDDLKAKLIADGIPADKVRFIHDAKTAQQKADLFRDAKSGKIAVLVGSTEKMGTGTNIQNRATALHHLDCPWRPADLEQRDGRIVRQGNQHDEVEILRYVTRGTFDTFSWQTVERKAGFIQQIKTGSLDTRSMEDVGDAALDASEIKALASDNPLLLDQALVSRQLKKIRGQKRAHDRNIGVLKRVARDGQSRIELNEAQAASLRSAAGVRTDLPEGTFAMRLGPSYSPTNLTDKKRAIEALGRELGQHFEGYLQGGESYAREFGEFRGIKLKYATVNDQGKQPFIKVYLSDPADRYDNQNLPIPPVLISKDSLTTETGRQGAMTRIENLVAGLEKRADGLDSQNTQAREEIAEAEVRSQRVFKQDEELALLEKRNKALDQLLKTQGAENPSAEAQSERAYAQQQYDEATAAQDAIVAAKKVTADRSRPTATGASQGTPVVMAPERTTEDLEQFGSRPAQMVEDDTSDLTVADADERDDEASQEVLDSFDSDDVDNEAPADAEAVTMDPAEVRDLAEEAGLEPEIASTGQDAPDRSVTADDLAAAAGTDAEDLPGLPDAPASAAEAAEAPLTPEQVDEELAPDLPDVDDAPAPDLAGWEDEAGRKLAEAAELRADGDDAAADEIVAEVVQDAIATAADVVTAEVVDGPAVPDAPDAPVTTQGFVSAGALRPGNRVGIPQFGNALGDVIGVRREDGQTVATLEYWSEGLQSMQRRDFTFGDNDQLVSGTDWRTPDEDEPDVTPEEAVPSVTATPDAPDAPDVTPPAGDSPTLASLGRQTAKGHGLKDGDRAFVADRAGTVRTGRLRKASGGGGGYDFVPDDEAVEPFWLGGAASKFRAQKIDVQGPTADAPGREDEERTSDDLSDEVLDAIGDSLADEDDEDLADADDYVEPVAKGTKKRKVGGRSPQGKYPLTEDIESTVGQPGSLPWKQAGRSNALVRWTDKATGETFQGRIIDSTDFQPDGKISRYGDEWTMSRMTVVLTDENWNDVGPDENGSYLGQYRDFMVRDDDEIVSVHKWDKGWVHFNPENLARGDGAARDIQRSRDEVARDLELTETLGGLDDQAARLRGWLDNIDAEIDRRALTPDDDDSATDRFGDALAAEDDDDATDVPDVDAPAAVEDDAEQRQESGDRDRDRDRDSDSDRDRDGADGPAGPDGPNGTDLPDPDDDDDDEGGTEEDRRERRDDRRRRDRDRDRGGRGGPGGPGRPAGTPDLPGNRDDNDRDDDDSADVAEPPTRAESDQAQDRPADLPDDAPVAAQEQQVDEPDDLDQAAAGSDDGDSQDSTPDITAGNGEVGRGINFEVNGDGDLVLSGRTFPVKDQISATRQFRFDRPTKAWVGRERGAEAQQRALNALREQMGVEAPERKAARTPTPQQQSIIDAILRGDDVAVEALAGTGKTSTLEATARAVALADPKKRIFYGAFNKTVQVEAQGRMPSNVEARTGDSVGYAAAPKPLQDKYQGMRAKKGDPKRVAALRSADEVAQQLGITRPLYLDEDQALSPARQAQMALRAVTSYAISADDELGEQHLDGAPASLLPYARKAWADIIDPDGKLFIGNDHLTKMWALGRPDLSKSGSSGLRTGADIVFFDEAQDMNPVIAKVLADNRGNVQLVYVGDGNQAIYGFRGANDELAKAQVDSRLPMTQTFRFGQPIASFGNRYLAMSDSPHRLEGMGEGGDVLDAGSMTDPDAILVRSNGGMVGEAIREQEAGRVVGVPKGTKADLRKLVQTSRYLQEVTAADAVEAAGGERPRVIAPAEVHDDLAPFKNWGEVVEAAEDGDDPKVRMLAGIVQDAGIDGLDAMVRDLKELGDEKDARTPDVVITTAHKAKGLEWDRVKIGDDFRGPKKDRKTGQVVMPEPEELRLAYVAVTRAMKALDPGSLNWVRDYTDADGNRLDAATTRVSSEDLAEALRAADIPEEQVQAAVQAAAEVAEEPAVDAPDDARGDAPDASVDARIDGESFDGDARVDSTDGAVPTEEPDGDRDFADTPEDEPRRPRTPAVEPVPEGPGPDPIAPVPDPTPDVPDVPEEPEDVSGLRAQWVPVGALMLGDTARVRGIDQRQRTVERAGYVQDVQEVTVARRRRGNASMYAVTLSDNQDGTGDSGTVLVSPNGIAARAMNGGLADPEGDGAARSLPEIEVLEGTIPMEMPKDSAGEPVWPGSEITVGGQPAVASAVGPDSVEVNRPNDSGNEPTVRPSSVTVTDGGAARPEGWTADGEPIREGSLVDTGDGVPAVVTAVDGDDVEVTGADGEVREVDAPDVAVAGAPTDVPADIEALDEPLEPAEVDAELTPDLPDADVVETPAAQEAVEVAADVAEQADNLDELRETVAETLLPESTGPDPDGSIDRVREDILNTINRAEALPDETAEETVQRVADEVRDTPAAPLEGEVLTPAQARRVVERGVDEVVDGVQQSLYAELDKLARDLDGSTNGGPRQAPAQVKVERVLRKVEKAQMQQVSVQARKIAVRAHGGRQPKPGLVARIAQTLIRLIRRIVQLVRLALRAWKQGSPRPHLNRAAADARAQMPGWREMRQMRRVADEAGIDMPDLPAPRGPREGAGV